MTDSTLPPQQTKPENKHTLLNILCNILIPVMILNKGNHILGPLYSLILALAFPIAYGSFELLKKRQFNMFSILGITNVAITGGLALAGLGGMWFAIKDAAFPALIGLFVFASAFTQKPFIKTMFLNPSLVRVDLLQQKLTERNQDTEFLKHIKLSTILLSLSFVFSATLNFILAVGIFTPIDPSLAPEQRSILLNQQIAKMSSTSAVVILVPSMIFMMLLFWYLFRGIKKLTGLSAEEILHS